MPYIITTLNTALHGEPMEDQSAADIDGATRTAVATLDEARDAAHAAVKANRLSGHRVRFVADALLTAANLPECGGTVGPLPDGTVIEARQVDWATVWASANLPHYASDYRDDEILAAFNA